MCKILTSGVWISSDKTNDLFDQGAYERDWSWGDDESQKEDEGVNTFTSSGAGRSFGGSSL
jgi:hypothetical protein